jgi:serine/threonine protein kinase
MAGVMRPQWSPILETITKPRPFGHYFILEKIAQGGMAEIFKGLTYDFSGLKKFIVIKRILPHIAVNKEFIHMLIDEAKIAVCLNHGNIAQTFDLGKVAEDYFIVMEFVEGRTISQLFKKSVALKESLPIPMACFIVSEICQGLDYIHRRQDEYGDPLGIVHCDISPQNVIIGPAGTVKIVDFGVAKAVSKLSDKERGILKGKFAYMSPEQTEGVFVDARSDLFSAGVVLWEVLTGRRLFKKKTNGETIEAVNSMAVYPPSAYRNEIPSELDEIVMKALARDPNQRYPSAHDLSLALTKFNLKHFPGFKPAEIGGVISRLFEDEDNTSDLFNEKTHHEESTANDSRRISALYREEDRTPSEDTALVDPQELDFQSVFDDFDLEEPSEVTKSVGWIAKAPDPAEMEPTVGLPDMEQHPTKAKPFSPAPPAFTLREGLMILGAILLFLLLFGWLTHRSSPAGKAQNVLEEGSGVILEVESDPPGAAIYIDDQMTGKTTPARLETKDLDFPLVVGVSKAGAPQWTQTIPEAPKETLKIQADLNAKWATLDLLSQPSGASVYFDQEFLGKTPLYAQRVPAEKSLKISFQLEGYRPMEQGILLKTGQNHRLEPVLQKSPSR